MKKTAQLLFLAIACLMLSALSTKAQTLWGTFPDAFFHSSTTGDYGEAFKDVSVGTAGRSIFISPDNTIYSIDDNYRLIYRFKAGDLRPSVVFRSDTVSSLFVNFIDFQNGHIYGNASIPSGPSIFRVNLDGSGFTILRSNSADGGYGGLIQDGDKIFGGTGAGVFTMNIDGSDYHVIRTITDPAERLSKLVVHSETDLWALSEGGGLCGRGAVFALAKDGSTFYKLVEFRGDDNCGIPPPDENGEETPPEEELPYALSNGERPVGLIKDNQDNDWFVITELGGGYYSDEGRGTLSMIGEDGFTPLHNFDRHGAFPTGNLVMNSSGQLFGLGGVFDDNGGIIFKYDFTGGGYSVVFDFDHDDIGSLVTCFGLAPDGRFYGQAERTTFNYMQASSLFSLNQDGSDAQRLLYFKEGFSPIDMAYGEDKLVGIFGKGSETGYGGSVPTMFTYSETGITTFYDFGDNANTNEADSALLSLGNDGFAYVIIPTYNYALKVKLDGSASQKLDLPYFLTHSPLAATSSGLFGASYYDSTNTGGFLYKVNTDFDGINVIYSFAQPTGRYPHGKITEGSDNFLYGMTSAGGSSNLGVIFKIKPDGTDYSVIHHFAGSDGATPYGGLHRDGDFFYGLTSAGGVNSSGTLFKIKYDGTSFSKLFDFGGANGTNPKGDLVEDGDGYLYGVTRTGGANNKGVLFKTDKSGSLSVLKNFDRSPRLEHLTFASQPVGETSHLVSPADDELDVSGSPDLKFSSAKYAVFYTLELSLNPAFTGTIITKTINGTIGQIDGLSYSTTYYARVKVDATPGYGPVTSFTTRALSSDAFVLSPADSAVFVPINNVSVTANAVTGASLYTIELNTSADFTGTSFVQTSPSAGERTLIFNGLSNFTVYYARVKTDINSELGVRTHFTTIGLESYVIDPEDNETGVGQFMQIKFQPVPGASRYFLLLNFTRSNGTTGTQTVDSNEPSINFSGLVYSSVYTAQVKTDVNPNYGPIITFSTKSSELDSYVVNPVNGAVNVPTNVVVTSNIVGEAEHYTIELNTSSDFTGTSFVQSSPTPFIWYVTFTELATSTTYYSRVKTELSPEWGPTRSFTTVSVQDVHVTDPTEGKQDVSVTPLVKIKPLSGATQYTLQLSKSSGFNGPTLTFTSNEPNIRTTPLEYSSTYYTRAKTNTNAGYGLVTSFTTHDPNKFAFVSSPVDGAMNVATNNLKITANIVYGATTYTIELNTDPNFTGTSIIKTSAVSGQRTITFNGLAAGTKYYNRVKTNLYPVYGPVRSFTTVAQPTFVIEPVNGKTEVIITQLIKVQPVQAATQYTLELSKTSDFAIVATYTSIASQFGASLQYSTTYYTRVKTNLTGYGAVTTFTTHAPEKFSFVSSPVNGATNVGTVNVPITANIVYGATSYTIELNTSSDFTGTSIVRSSAVPNQRGIIFPSLAPSTTYYNRTMTNLPSGWGPVRSFTTGPAFSAPPAIDETSGVRVYPNPFYRNFTTENPGVEKVVITVTDVTGREMFSKEIAGFNKFESGEDLSSGIYLMKVRNGNKITIHRLVKE